jgi:hypothetical protein
MTHKYKVKVRVVSEYVAYAYADDEEDAYEAAVDAIDAGSSHMNYEEQWREYERRDVERAESDYDPDAARDDRDCLLFAELHG